MDSPLDDKALAVLDDYCDALRQEDTEEELSASSCPMDSNDTTRGFFQLLKELDDARRILKDDSRAHLGEELLPPSEPPALPELFGRYLIRGPLGQGGMGAVYLAHDTQLERDVALKVPRFSRADDRAVRERFQREARAAATLHHPNICPVYDSGEIDGVPYLTMAFIEGQPLVCQPIHSPVPIAPGDETVPPSSSANNLVPGSPLGPHDPEAPASAFRASAADREVATLIRKVALALDYAHSRGVVHRDLKPGNIMLDHRGEPIVVDFGLARREQNVADTTLTQPGVILGSLAYMSPEQALGEHEQVGPTSDLYTLAVILHELLTGKLPYRGRRSSVLGHIISSEPVELAHDLDPRLKTICAKALAKPTGDRFASMAEFAAALQDFLDGNKKITGVTAAPASFLFKTPTRLFSSIVLLVVLLGAAFGGLIVITLQSKDGTLVVEVNEPGAKVTVLNERGEVEITRASDGGTLKLSVDPGKHRLKVEKDGFSVFAKEFAVGAGATDTIKASLGAAPPKLPETGVAIPAPAGVIAWWSGDGHARDLVGDHHGTINGGVTFAPGAVGQAFSFDGFDGLIRVRSSEALNPRGGFTIECWVCCRPELRWQDIIKKWGFAQNDCSFVLQRTHSGRAAFALSESGKNSSRFDLAQFSSEAVLTPETWVHVAATFDTHVAQLYLNGVEAGSQSVEGERFIHRGSADVEIGAQRFAGLIDELCLYDRALGTAEIEAIFRAGAAGKIKPSIAAQLERHQVSPVAADVERNAELNRKTDLATASQRVKDYATAAVLLQEVWQGRQETLGPRDLLTIDAENMLGDSLAKLGKYEEAERHLLASYAAVPQAKSFPKVWLPIYRRRLAELYAAWGKPEEAKKWRDDSKLEDSQPSASAVEGPEIVARKLESEGDYVQATDVRRAIWQERVKRLGPDHRLTSDAESLLGIDLARCGKYEEAEEHLLNSNYSIHKTKDVPNDWLLEFKLRLAKLYQLWGKVESQAIWQKDYVKTSQARVESRSPGTMDRSTELWRLGRGMAQLDDFAAAETAFRECLEIREKIAPGHWRVFNARASLGWSLLGQQRYEGAEPLLLSGYGGLKKLRSDIDASNKHLVVEVAQHLAELYEAWDKPDQAEKWRAAWKEELQLLAQ